MTPLEIRNSALKLYVSNGILLVTSVFAFCPQKSLMTGFFCFLYPMQLVTPSVVAIAVSMLMAICRIVFQVFAFILLNVEC